ncbi:MAG: hypothetical protein IPL49_15315 [Saprospirales bacterium]|nr:hypothetical protein [Saprospirales bacterium]
MTQYKISLSSDKQQVKPGEPVSLSILTTPSPDSGIVVRLFEEDTKLTENENGNLTLDTAFNEAGEKILTFWMEAFRLEDSSLVRDTASIAIDVIKDQAEVETPAEVTRIDLRRKAQRAKWFAEFANTQAAKSLSYGALENLR